MLRRTLRGLAVCGALAVLAPAGRARAMGTCGKGGQVGEHVNVKFGASEYWVWAPAIDPLKAVPLVLAMHGDEGSPEGSQSQFWKAPWRATKDFIVVAPRAPYAGGSWYMDWNGHTQFIDSLLNEIFAKYNVDIDRIYATGDSGGSVFLSVYAFKHQEFFAGVQLSCGASSQPGFGYEAAPRADCKTATRFVVSKDDFLYSPSVKQADFLRGKGNPVDWFDAPCSGHCCGPDAEYGSGAWNWMKTHTNCTLGVNGPGCGMPGDLPTGAPPDAGRDAGAGGMSGADGGGAGGGGAKGGDGGGGNGGGNGSGGDSGGSGGKAQNDIQSAGCACHVPAGSPHALQSTLAALAPLVAAARRRRRRA